MADKKVEILLDFNSDLSGINEAESGLLNLSKKTQELSDELTSFGKKSAVAFAGFASAIALSVAESLDAEKTTARLSQAIANQGRAFKGSIEDVQKFSDALSKKLRVDDDEVDSIQATLLAYGVQEKDLQRLTGSVYDYAAATGTDATSAVDRFKRAAAGGATSLKAFNAIALNAKGSAERLANTDAGRLQGFNVAVNDLRQTIGDELLPTLVRAATVATNFINALSANKAFSSIIAPILLVGAALTGFLAIVGLVGGQVLAGAAFFLKFASVIQTSVIPAIVRLTTAALANPIILAALLGAAVGVGLIVFFDALTKRFGDSITPLKLLTAAFLIFWGIATAGIVPLVAGIILLGKVMYDLFKSTRSIGDAFKLLWASIKLGFADAINVIIKGVNSLRKLFGQKPLELINKDQLKKDIEELKKPADKTVTTKEVVNKQTNDISKGITAPVDKTNEDKKKTYAEDLAAYEKANTDKLVSSQGYIAQQQALNKQLRDDSFTQNLTELELNQQKLDAESAQLEVWHQTRLAAVAGNAEAVAQVEGTYLQRSNDLQKQKNDIDKKVLAERFGLAKTFFGNLAVLSKDAAEVQKGIALSEAIINGFLAVSKAIASAPFPFNIPGIAFAVAQSAAQVAGIQAQSFAVGTTNIPQDQLANVHAGEMIIPKTFAQGIRAGDVNLGGGADNQQQTVVNNVINVNLDGAVFSGTPDDQLVLSIGRKMADAIKSNLLAPLPTGA